MKPGEFHKYAFGIPGFMKTPWGAGLTAGTLGLVGGGLAGHYKGRSGAMSEVGRELSAISDPMQAVAGMFENPDIPDETKQELYQALQHPMARQQILSMIAQQGAMELAEDVPSAGPMFGLQG